MSMPWRSRRSTKSGTNQFTGSGYYFGRDQKLDATNAFATSKLPFNQTRAGGSLGGPIAANKTHFFAAAEKLNVNNTTLVSLPATNPFAALENGMFPVPTREKMGDVKIDLFKDPFYAPLARFRGDAEAGKYLGTLQPRVGAAYDVSGNGSLVVRGGWGRYVTRNRPWFETRTMNQTTSSAVFITDPNALRFFPNINAVLGGQSLAEFAATASANIGTLISDDTSRSTCARRRRFPSPVITAWKCSSRPSTSRIT
jgi:hypothetical protein